MLLTASSWICWRKNAKKVRDNRKETQKQPWAANSIFFACCDVDTLVDVTKGAATDLPSEAELVSNAEFHLSGCSDKERGKKKVHFVFFRDASTKQRGVGAVCLKRYGASELCEGVMNAVTLQKQRKRGWTRTLEQQAKKQSFTNLGQINWIKKKHNKKGEKRVLFSAPTLS